MQIGVIGAGALGSLLAARLTRAGHEVQVVARGQQRDTIAAHGIEVRGGFGDDRVAVRVVDHLEAVELCLVCTKAHDAAAALESHAGELPSIPVVMMQNGIDATTIARNYLAKGQIFGGISLIAANFTEAGVVTVTNPQPTFIGRGSGPADQPSREIAALLNDAVPTTAIDEFEGALWTKLILNMINAIPAITGQPVQEAVTDPFLLKVLTASMREAARVGLAAKVSFAKLHQLDATLVTQLAQRPLWRAKQIPLRMARGMGPVPNLASTLQSIRRGRPTEIDYLNGAIVRTAEGIGMDAPINRALTALVHEVESGGPHLSSEQLRTALAARGVRL